MENNTGGEQRRPSGLDFNDRRAQVKKRGALVAKIAQPAACEAYNSFLPVELRHRKSRKDCAAGSASSWMSNEASLFIPATIFLEISLASRSTTTTEMRTGFFEDPESTMRRRTRR